MENNIPERGITITRKMKNKTKEQLACDYAKKTDVGIYSNLFPNCGETIGEICQQDFMAGRDARQPEIDALNYQINLLNIDMNHYKKIAQELSKF